LNIVADFTYGFLESSLWPCGLSYRPFSL